METTRRQDSHTLSERERTQEREARERKREQDMRENDWYNDIWSILMWFDERNDVKRERKREHFQPPKLSLCGWRRGVGEREREGRAESCVGHTKLSWNCPKTVEKLSWAKKLSFKCLLTVVVCGIGSVGRESCRESCVTRSECWKWANLRPLIWSSFALWLWGR